MYFLYFQVTAPLYTAKFCWNIHTNKANMSPVFNSVLPASLLSLLTNTGTTRRTFWNAHSHQQVLPVFVQAIGSLRNIVNYCQQWCWQYWIKHRWHVCFVSLLISDGLLCAQLLPPRNNPIQYIVKTKSGIINSARSRKMTVNNGLKWPTKCFDCQTVILLNTVLHLMWVHKKCSGIKDRTAFIRLVIDVFVCSSCVKPVNGCECRIGG